MISKRDEIIFKLCERVSALERRLDPPAQPVEPVRPLPAVGATERIAMANMRMSREVMQPMLDATPNDLMLQIRSDKRAEAPTSVLAGADAGPARMPATGAVRKLKSGYQG
jgi:hypothetical protein